MDWQIKSNYGIPDFNRLSITIQRNYKCENIVVLRSLDDIIGLQHCVNNWKQLCFAPHGKLEWLVEYILLSLLCTSKDLQHWPHMWPRRLLCTHLLAWCLSLTDWVRNVNKSLAVALTFAAITYSKVRSRFPIQIQNHEKCLGEVKCWHRQVGSCLECFTNFVILPWQRSLEVIRKQINCLVLMIAARFFLEEIKNKIVCYDYFWPLFIIAMFLKLHSWTVSRYSHIINSSLVDYLAQVTNALRCSKIVSSKSFTWDKKHNFRL